MRSFLFLIVFFINGIVVGQVAQFPQIYYNGQGTTGANVYIHQNADISSTNIDQFSTISKIGAVAQITNNNDPQFLNWVQVCLPSSDGNISYGYIACDEFYARIDEVNNYATVTATSLFIRPTAGNTTQFVTIGGQNARYGQNSIVALTGMTSNISGVIWYEVYLTFNCSQSKGWLSGSFLNIATLQSYKNIGGRICTDAASCNFLGSVKGATINFGSLAMTISSAGYYQYKLPVNWSGSITCYHPNYDISTPSSYTYTANANNYLINFVLSNSSGCVTPGTPVSLSATPTNDSVTLNWAQGNPVGSATVSYYWAIGTTTSVSYESNFIHHGITNSQTVTQISLTPGTNYYWKIKAVTSCDNSVSSYSAATPFSTMSATFYNIAGTVANGGNGLNAVTLLASPGNYITSTNSVGQYSFSLPQGWSGTIKPTLANYQFTPLNKSYSNLSSNLINEDYISSSAIPSTISILNHIAGFTDAPLWSGTLNQSSSSPIKICADGSEATIITYVNNDPYITTNNIRFWIHSDQFGNDVSQSGYFINYIVTGNKVMATYAHPKYLNETYTPFKSDIIDIVDYTQGTPYYQIPINIYRAPILFVHGFNADASTFKESENLLINNFFYPALPQSPLTYRVDYSSSSLSHFIDNRYVVSNAIDNLFLKVRNDNYSAGKVIIIGHSMGGILSRLYLQNKNSNYRYDIAKLITINTPHYGTQFANWGLNKKSLLYAILKIMKKNGTVDQYYGAIEDLKVNSSAIMDDLNMPVNEQNKVPSTTLSTDQALDPSFEAFAIREILNNEYEDHNLFQDETHDLIVPMSSQKGGITSQQTVFGQWHSGSTDNTSINTQLRDLINADPAGSLFEHNGFQVHNLQPPSFLKTVNSNLENIITSSDSIKILNPNTNQQYSSGNQVNLDVYYTSGISKIGLVVYGNGIEPITIDTANVNQFSFQIPDHTVGEINLLLLGGDVQNWFSFDTIHINVSPTIIPDSIVIESDSNRAPLGISKSYLVNAYFNGSLNPVNILGSDSLYVQYNSSFVSQIDKGIFKTIRTGITDIIYQFMGKSDTIKLTIYNDPSILHASFDYSTTNIHPKYSVNYYDKSQGNAISYEWYFEGGIPTFSTQKNPVVIYPQEGIYKVKLKTSFVNGIDSIRVDSLVKVKSEIYTFNGNGDWDDASNWTSSTIPPNDLISGSEIIIDPVSNGECFLNRPQSLQSASKLTIRENKHLNVSGDIRIETGPPIITCSEITFLTQNSAVCNGYLTYGSNSPISEIGFCYSTVENPTISDNSIVSDIVSDQFTSSLINLLSSTNYYVRAYAINAVGITYSNQVIFRTKSFSQLPNVLQTNNVTQITATTALSGGSINIGPVTMRGVCWSIDSNPTIQNSKSVDSIGIGDYISRLTNLLPNTTYHVRSYATNDIGTSYGPDKSFTTTNSPFYLDQPYAGGTIFYIDTSGIHGLIRAVGAIASNVKWSPYENADITNATDTIAGFNNTYQIINVFGNSNSYAAKLCADYRGGGYSDWYLPSSKELSLVQFPNYLWNCWTSTEIDQNNAVVYFLSSVGGTMDKNTEWFVTPIRKF